LGRLGNVLLGVGDHHHGVKVVRHYHERIHDHARADGRRSLPLLTHDVTQDGKSHAFGINYAKIAVAIDYAERKKVGACLSIVIAGQARPMPTLPRRATVDTHIILIRAN